jgi:hypothetical protein
MDRTQNTSHDRNWKARPCKDEDPCANCEVGYGGGCQDPAQGGEGYGPRSAVATEADIVERLYGYAERWAPGSDSTMAGQAADEIKRLQSKLVEIETYIANNQTEVSPAAYGALIAIIQGV